MLIPESKKLGQQKWIAGKPEVENGTISLLLSPEILTQAQPELNDRFPRGASTDKSGYSSIY
jgi:hypothetical protein